MDLGATTLLRLLKLNVHRLYNKDQKPEVTERSTPKDAPLYAQGYLDEPLELQPTRATLPKDEGLWQFCWDYHQGRLLTWNIAGNNPSLSAGTQLGIADRRALTIPSDTVGRTRGQIPKSS